VTKNIRLIDLRTLLETPAHPPDCITPQITIRPATTNPNHDTDMGIECDPICTDHPFISLTR
jgi:hypothetical protein